MCECVLSLISCSNLKKSLDHNFLRKRITPLGCKNTGEISLSLCVQMTELYVCPLVDTDATERAVVAHTHTQHAAQLANFARPPFCESCVCVFPFFFIRYSDGAAGWRDAAILSAVYLPLPLPFPNFEQISAFFF